LKRILCSLLVATLPFGSILAETPKSKNAKVTLLYQHELPNVPGKSIKGVLVEYGPGGYSPGHTHAKCRSARRLSNVSSVQAGSTPSSQPCTRRSCKKSAATMARLAAPIHRETGAARTQPLRQLRPPPPARGVTHRDGHGLLLPHQHDQPLASGDTGVEKIPLQHGVITWRNVE